MDLEKMFKELPLLDEEKMEEILKEGRS